MMRLHYSATSPYVRKVSVCILELGLQTLVERVPTNPWDPDTDLGVTNPLGKVPTLVTEEGQALFDSPVICEYLDSLTEEPTLFPPSGELRWRVLRLQALGDGLLDASVARFLELSKRTDIERSELFLERYSQAMCRVLDALDGEVTRWEDTLTIGQITVGCALGYVDFRAPELEWRQGRSALADWYARIGDRPSMQATVPHA